MYLDSPEPARPTDRGLRLRNESSVRLYVASFGGWADNKAVDAATRALEAALEAAGEEVEGNSSSFAAFYDNAYRKFNRYNEIWLRAAEQPDDTTDTTGLPLAQS